MGRNVLSRVLNNEFESFSIAFDVSWIDLMSALVCALANAAINWLLGIIVEQSRGLRVLRRG